jgi:ketosteroid isomerase-like protein
MTPADAAGLLNRFIAAWDAKDLEGVMALMSDDCTFRSSVGPEPGTTFIGRDEVQHGFAGFLCRDAPPGEVAVDPPEVLIGSDFAVTRWVLRPPGAPPVHGCDVFEFEGDRIRSKDTYRKVSDAR